MTKLELVQFLEKFADTARVTVCVNSYPVAFEICWGGSEGCTMATADTISFQVNPFQNEQPPPRAAQEEHGDTARG